MPPDSEEFPNGIDADSAVQWFMKMDKAVLRTGDDARFAEYLGDCAISHLSRILDPMDLNQATGWPPGYVCQLWQALQDVSVKDREKIGEEFRRFRTYDSVRTRKIARQRERRWADRARADAERSLLRKILGYLHPKR